MIKKVNQLNEALLKELEQLKELSKKADGSAPNFYPHILSQPRSLPVSLMYYENEQLMAFLSVFFFYEHAVEIAVLVHPNLRKKGIAKQLIHTSLPLIQTHNFKQAIFSSPNHLNDTWLAAKGFSAMHSEFYMERDDLSPLLDYNQTLSFREATIKDIAILCALDEACFPKKNANAQDRFQQLFSDRNYQIFMAYQHNQPIGKAHIRWGEEGATLSDISILPNLQGEGLGTALIAHCINYALSEGKPHLNLDVETHNKRALNLYTRLGFVTQNACDYWSIPIAELAQFVQPNS